MVSQIKIIYRSFRSNKFPSIIFILSIYYLSLLILQTVHVYTYACQEHKTFVVHILSHLCIQQLGSAVNPENFTSTQQLSCKMYIHSAVRFCS